MPSSKKTDKEKKATKKAQNKRYVQRKALQGLKAVTVYVPVKALEQCKNMNMKKIGLVVGYDDLDPVVVKAVKVDGAMRFEVVGGYVGSLPFK